jgi:hypothetical protein
MARLVLRVDPCHYMYGSIDDTSLPGEQETVVDSRGAIPDNYVVFYGETTGITVFLSSDFCR